MFSRIKHNLTESSVFNQTFQFFFFEGGEGGGEGGEMVSTPQHKDLCFIVVIISKRMESIIMRETMGLNKVHLIL